MEMKEIARQLGVETYPEILNTICQNLDDTPACDLGLIANAQALYKAFGTHYDYVVEGAKQINADPVYSAWVKTVHAYLADESLGSYRDLPVLPLNGTPKQDLAMLMTMIPFIPSAAATYAKGGFSEEEIAGYMQAYSHNLNSTLNRTGFVGLDKTYFMWLHHFAFAEIFRVHGIQFEFTKLNKNGAYLKNKNTGKVQPVMANGLIHHSGEKLVGAGGYEDETGAYQGELTETEDSFIAYAVVNCVAEKEKTEFPKTEWELIGKPGDKCLAMHLPRGSDIREENVRRACAAAFAVVEKSYPAYVGVPVQCASWLLDPGIEKLVGSDSNVVRFGKLFARILSKSPGRAADSFVFPGKPVADADLPEDTRLQRALKQHYLNGGYTYGTTGILVLD